MQERVVREIRTLRAMWRALETGSRQVLNGHEGGNPGHKPRMSLRATAPVLDPTRKEEILDFLRHLNKQIHRPILLIWDRLPGHRSRLVQQYLATLEGKIEAFYLPAYAPELNPAEYVRAHLKQHELPNFSARDLCNLSSGARSALRSMQRRRTIVTACWKQASLF